MSDNNQNQNTGAGNQMTNDNQNVISMNIGAPVENSSSNINNTGAVDSAPVVDVSTQNVGVTNGNVADIGIQNQDIGGAQPVGNVFNNANQQVQQYGQMASGAMNNVSNQVQQYGQVASGTIGNVSNQAQQVAGQAVEFGQQTTQAVGQVAGQAYQMGQQTTQAVGQVAGQAYQMGGQVMGTAQDAAQQAGALMQNLLMPKANQPKVSVEIKLMAALCYIPLLAAVILILKGEDAFVKLHGRQGLVFTALLFISIFIVIVPFIGGIMAVLLSFIIMIGSFYSGYQALIGNWWKIPVLGDIAEMIPVSIFTTVAKDAISGQPQQNDGQNGMNNN